MPEQLNAMLGQKLPQHAAGTISTLVKVEKGQAQKGGNQRYCVTAITNIAYKVYSELNNTEYGYGYAN